MVALKVELAHSPVHKHLPRESTDFLSILECRIHPADRLMKAGRDWSEAAKGSSLERLRPADRKPSVDVCGATMAVGHRSATRRRHSSIFPRFLARYRW